ncbi:DUF1289 domain-containing protein [Comamonadaceae bacterium G21597-S1]|nr:DUF1289 domain-containing protein [Comamonadaceae bacterium G21597-S1]
MNTADTLSALAELAQDPAHLVPSPCVSVCRMDPASGLCSGCLRTIDEIVAWGRMDEPAKRKVWAGIVQRVALRAA